ncbi:hypothetical protein JXL83_04920 [candidate division WOR-3 bacterium]|nr:hypothetical protein [candidate division WOR-3 bacterium]
MKNLLFFAVLFPISLLHAETKGPSGDDYIIPVIELFKEECDSDDVLDFESLSGNICETERTGNSTEPSKFSSFWGPNILVTDNCNTLYRDDMAFDYDAGGNIYAAIQSSHDGVNDTLFIYRSTDKGLTWNICYWNYVANGGKIIDFDMRLEPYTSVNPEIYIAWADSQFTSGYRTFFGAVKPGISERWVRLDSAFTSQDSIFCVAMDVSPDSNPLVAISTLSYSPYPGETEWATFYSADAGISWNLANHITSYAPMGLSVACNSREVFYVATIYTQNKHRMRLARYNNGTWSGNYISMDYDTLRTCPLIATQKYHTYPANYVCAFETMGSGSASRILYCYSSDGGQNWNSPDYWSVTGDRCSSIPNTRIGWNYTEDFPIASCFVEGGSFDSLVTSVCVGNFNGWSQRTVVNNYSLTTTIPSHVLYVSGLDINGPIVLYRQNNSNNIWFDRWDHYNQVEETLSNNFISSDVIIYRENSGFRIDLSTAGEIVLRISVFDILGRNIKTISDSKLSKGDHVFFWILDDENGDIVRSGNYFINFESMGQNFSKTIQVF